jgi:type III restriction enzyme
MRLTDDSCLIVETKGQEDLDVALKDKRARRWCEDATRLSGREWAYEKVAQKVFDAYTGAHIDGLRRFITAGSG